MNWLATIARSRMPRSDDCLNHANLETYFSQQYNGITDCVGEEVSWWFKLTDFYVRSQRKVLHVGN